MNAETIIMTGASGFIGSSIAKELIEKKYKVINISREGTNMDNSNLMSDLFENFVYDNNILSLIRLFEDKKPGCVFHLASHFIAEHRTEDITLLIQSNLTFGLHILEAMKKTDVKLFINTGTAWQHFNNEKYNPTCLYAATKQAFENLVEHYVRNEDFRSIHLHLFDTYGENDHRPKLLNVLAQFSKENKLIELTEGEQKLHLVHVKDVCNAYIIAYKLLKSNPSIKNKVYALPSRGAIKLKEILNIFEEETKLKLKVKWGAKPYRNREVMEPWHDFEQLPGWEPIISLKEGLTKLT